MSRREHIISVFVASPGDVSDEREKLEEIVNNLNIAWGKEQGVRFDLVKFETHSYPGFGDDAQAVINEQIPNDYDIFIGIMWNRFGTPTNRAGSGTQEEFLRAKKRHDENPGSVQILFYFKDALIAPSAINPDQLKKVQAFKKSISDGALCGNFNSLPDFEKLLIMHLTRQLQYWKNKIGEDTSRNRPEEKYLEFNEQSNEGNEIGLLDLVEISESRFEELEGISKRIALYTMEIGEKMNLRTNEIQLAVEAANGNLNRLSAMGLITKASKDMEQYAARINAELPLFSRNLNEGMDALMQGARLSIEMNPTLVEQGALRENIEAVSDLQEVLEDSKEALLTFRKTVNDLPRMTSILNTAKRKVVSVLDKLVREFENGQNLVREAEKLLKGAL